MMLAEPPLARISTYSVWISWNLRHVWPALDPRSNFYVCLYLNGKIYSYYLYQWPLYNSPKWVEIQHFRAVTKTRGECKSSNGEICSSDNCLRFEFQWIYEISSNFILHLWNSERICFPNSTKTAKKWTRLLTYNSSTLRSFGVNDRTILRCNSTQLNSYKYVLTEQRLWGHTTLWLFQ